MFYKGRKGLLGFLDEGEIGTNEVRPQKIVNTHNVMKKKTRKRWGEEAWA